MTLAHASASAGKPCAGCSKFSTYIYYYAHGIPIPPESREGHASNFLKHSYVHSASGDIFVSSLDRSTMPALSPLSLPLSPLAFAALSPLTFPALFPPQPCYSLAPPLPTWWRWRGHDYWCADGFPTNLRTVDTDPSSSVTTTSRPPQAMSKRGSDPSNHHENNYFIRDRGYSSLNPQRLLSARPLNLLYIHVNVD
jgi:hypothetical protein